MHRFIQITSGRGPEECEFAAANILNIFMKDAQKKGINASLIEKTSGIHKKTIRSAIVSLNGENLAPFMDSWMGSILWVGKSPFRPNHKRKNWYIKVSEAESIQIESSYRKEDIKIETMKASGPGGQHVNTTDSGVRLTYIPEKIVITAREERSQHLNKKLAFLRLEGELKRMRENEKSSMIKENWSMHNSLERGNPVKTFKGDKFSQKK